MADRNTDTTVQHNEKVNIMKRTDTFDDGTTIMVPMDTRLNGKGSKPISHAVTMDFTGCTLAHCMSLCVDAAKVKLQDKIRKHPSTFPAGALTVKVTTLGQGGGGVSDEMMAAWYRKLTPEGRKRVRDGA